MRRTIASRGLLQASQIDARLFNTFDRVAFEAASGFEAIELAPVCSLGLNRVLGAIDQNSMLTTLRNAEVLGDATMPLAVECWRRRKDSSRRGRPHPSASCEQPPRGPSPALRHARLRPAFPALFPGHGRPRHRLALLEIQHVGEHISCYLRLFRELGAHGFHLANPLVEISDTGIVRSWLAAHGVSSDDVRESIRAHRPGGSRSGFWRIAVLCSRMPSRILRGS